MASTPGITNYAEIQEMEVQALQSIFADDFQEDETKTGAWNKKTERVFKLTLKPPSFPETGLSAVLHVRLPNTYPKTGPVCSVDFNDDVPLATRKAVNSIVKTKVKSLLGQEMIYEIADCIQTELDATASRIADAPDVPTLEEERAAQRAAQEAAAQQKEDEARAEQLEQQNEEERTLKLMVESARAKQKKHVSKPSTTSEASEGSFDTIIKIKDRSGVLQEFKSISSKRRFRVGPVTTVYTASSAPLSDNHLGMNGLRMSNKSIDSNISDEDTIPFLALKECSIPIPAANLSSKLNQFIETLEGDLRSLQDLKPHAGVCNPLAFRLEKMRTAWTVRILLPYYEKGSLHDLIDFMGPLDAKHIRSFTIQILEALNHLHRHRVVHSRVSAKNIMLERTDSGLSVLKLSDALFQQELHKIQNTSAKFSSASSAFWHAPESADNDAQPTTTKDIWDAGVVLLQMAFGLDVQQQFNSPTALMENSNLSEAFEDLLTQFFKADPKKRPSAFNIVTDEFLRSDKPVFDEEDQEVISRVASSNSAQRTSRTGRDYQNLRYGAEFVEQGRLGKGGFGEVVLARKKIDGSTYAVKKIVQKSKAALSSVLSEAVLLSKLNNPFIVRYYDAWIEEVGILKRPSFSTQDDSESSIDIARESISHLTSSRRKELDFVSSQDDYGGFQFGYDTGDENDHGSEAGTDVFERTEDEDDGDDEDDDEEDDDEENSDSPEVLMNVRRRPSADSKLTLYIQMEFCERQTLRDLIRDNLHTKNEECWRLFRQILEGLVYIHSHGVIHRDLKPENIFITLDQSNAVRIGDFGLARPGEATNKVRGKGFAAPHLTASIGTSVYVAPEVKSSGGGSYNEKADMYSLGIMLFEMSYPVTTGMERAKILNDLRENPPKLPEDFNKAMNAEIILNLVKHKVSERPSSQELLHSAKMPSHVEDETIRLALRTLSDKASPYYTRFIGGLFDQGTSNATIDYAYDLDTGLKYTYQDQVLESWVQDQIVSVFRRHCAVQIQRSELIPYSPQYYSDRAARFLNRSGHVVQLPFDLTLPFARMLAKSDVNTVARKSFTFGSVFRDSQAGVHPIVVGEVDFDIVSDNSLDLALREAEVIKVMDEIVDCIPSLAGASISYHISHSKLLNTILTWCKVPKDRYTLVKQSLSKLNTGTWTWPRIKSELRASDIAISSTCLESLSRFNFQDTYENAVEKLRSIFQDSQELESTFRHLEAVVTYLARFHVKRDILINPLASFNEQFYSGNLLFRCMHRVTRKKRIMTEVLSAGGRYDKLIQDLRTGSRSGAKHAVGFNLSWKNVVDSMTGYRQGTESAKAFLKKSEETSSSLPSSLRSNVLVDSVDSAMLRSNGISIVQELWSNGINAELVIDSDVREGRGHHQQGREDTPAHDWILLIKQDGTLKIRSMITKEDTEIRTSELVGWIRSEQRERERMEGSKKTVPQFKREASEVVDRDSDITVLVAQSKTKKANRRNIVEDAQARAAELSQSYLDSPFLAVELKDDLFEGIRETRLSDSESWRRYIQSGPLADRQYLGQLHNVLLEKAAESESKFHKTCWIYNFRSRACFLYDLGRVSEK